MTAGLCSYTELNTCIPLEDFEIMEAHLDMKDKVELMKQIEEKNELERMKAK